MAVCRAALLLLALAVVDASVAPVTCGEGTMLDTESNSCVVGGAGKQIPTMSTEKGGVTFSVDGAKLSLTPDYTCYSSCEEGASKPCAGPSVTWDEEAGVCQTKADFLQIGDQTIDLADVVSKTYVDNTIKELVAKAVEEAVKNATAGLPEKLDLISSMNIKVEDLVGADYPGQVGALKSRMDTIEALDLGQTTSSISTRVQALEGLDISSKLSSASTRLDALEDVEAATKISAISTRIDAIEGMGISATVSGINTAINGLQTSVTNLQANDLDSRLSVVENSVQDLENIDAATKLGGHDARIGVLEAAGAAAAISGLATRVGAIEAKNLDTSIAGVEARVDAIEASDFTSSIGTVGTNVATLSTTVTDGLAHLDDLEAEIEEIKASHNDTLLIQAIGAVVAASKDCEEEEEIEEQTPTAEGTKSSFVHWGRQDCPTGTTLIAKGWVAGGRDDHAGSTTSTFCMMYKPEYGASSQSDQNGNLLYRAEYYTGSNQIPTLSGLNGGEVACAICGLPDSTSTYMVPGIRHCPADKSGLLYEGYIMAQRHNSVGGKGQFICVDKNGDVIPGSVSSASSGSRLYPTETQDPPEGIFDKPYFHDAELTCAVCKYDEPEKYHYVQWGADTCTGTGVTTNYEGWIGGGYYNHAGGGVNHQCMPGYAEYTDAVTSNENGALIYVVEYETSGYGATELVPLSNKDAACTSCTSSADTLWIPGRTACPTDMNTLYNGYVMSSHYSHIHPSTYICVDKNAKESKFTPNGDRNHGRIYPTEADAPIGSGTAQFTNNKEIACATCAFKDAKQHSYIRWGRDTCPTGSALMYDGWMGRGPHSNTGSGTQALCMPNNGVQYLDASTTNENGARVMRMEYETSGRKNVPASWLALHNREVPCAVCKVPRVTHMFPGKLTCPEGMQVEYAGYLMGGYFTHVVNQDTDCVDRNAIKWKNSGTGDNNHARLYFTEFESPPRQTGYLHNVEVTCVVCSHEA